MIQLRNGGKGRAHCYVQGAYQNDSVSVHVRKEEGYLDEYLRFKECQVFSTVPLPKGTKVLGTTKRLDYKVDNAVLTKRKVCMCEEGISRQRGVSILLICIRLF